MQLVVNRATEGDSTGRAWGLRRPAVGKSPWVRIQSILMGVRETKCIEFAALWDIEPVQIRKRTLITSWRVVKRTLYK
jgi:hypothetical protein